jgi:hypothetical protein
LLDGRVVRLGLHKTIDATYGREVSVDVWAAGANETWPELFWLVTMTPDERSAFFEQHRAKQRGRIERSAYRRGPDDTRPVSARTPRDAEPGSPNVLVFRDDDRGYLDWVAANPEGFVVNIRRALNPSDARVHRADCWTIAGEPARGKSWTGPYIRLCATELRELDSWATERFETRIERCGTCRPSAA